MIPSLLAEGELRTVGLLPRASNYTFLAEVTDGRTRVPVVYKPRQGEIPLWDFPEGTLCNREVAAFLVAEALGWPNVPPTTLRDGPHGEGAVQLFVRSDPAEHYFTLRERFPEEFRRVAAFDVITGNGDRKAGHCLLDADGRIWVVDHGLCFAEHPWLRTVIWDFAGQRVAEPVLADVERLATDVPGALCELLHPVEVDALVERARRLLRVRKLPMPPPGYRAYPWPLV